jgi:hypothetical protein
MKQVSFALTKRQVINRSKTVTRRLGWKTLMAGELLQAIDKGQGIPKGCKVKKLGVVRAVHVRREPLSAIRDELNGTALEGFPEMSADAFIEMFCKTHGHCEPDTEITRIEYEYVDDAEAETRRAS